MMSIGVGVGDASASPTAALLLTILQESMGRVATILFAHRLGMIEDETMLDRHLDTHTIHSLPFLQELRWNQSARCFVFWLTSSTT